MRALLLLFAAALGCHAQTGGFVSGRVLSTLRNEAIAGATVTLRGLASEHPQTYITETDAEGRFFVANMAPGVYEPRPAKPGFEQRTPNHFATADDFPPVTIEAGKTAPAILLHLIPDGVIAGRVTDSEGEPVRRAQLEVERYQYVSGKKQLQPVRSAQTDDHGQYRLYHLPPGKYYLHAEAGPQMFPGGFGFFQSGAMRMVGNPGVLNNAPAINGLGAVFYPESPDAAHATQIEVAPGAEIDGMDVRLLQQRLYSIRGKTGMANGEQNWSVFAQSLDGKMHPNFPTSFGAGEYEVKGVPPGKYVIIGQQFPARNNDGTPRKYAREKVEVIDRDVEHVDLTFSPGATLKGVVKAEGGVALKDVAFNFNPSPEESMIGGAQARAKEDGSFSVDLGPGVYRLRVFSPKYYIKSLLIGKAASPDRTIDAAHPAGDLTLIVSDDFGKVEGTVVDDSGKLVYNANVTLIPDQKRPDWEERFRSGLTKTDGKFSFSNVEPGEYRAYAWLGVEQGAPQDADFRKPFEDRGVTIAVTPGNSRPLTLKVIRPDNR